MGMLLCLDRKQRLIFTLARSSAPAIGRASLGDDCRQLRQCWPCSAVTAQLHDYSAALWNKSNPPLPEEDSGFIEHGHVDPHRPCCSFQKHFERIRDGRGKRSAKLRMSWSASTQPFTASTHFCSFGRNSLASALLDATTCAALHLS